MGKKPETFGERLKRSVEQYNRRAEKNRQLYRKMCKQQGVKVGEPISLMDMIKKKK